MGSCLPLRLEEKRFLMKENSSFWKSGENPATPFVLSATKSIDICPF